jgi:hypothetical protein
MSEKQKSQEVIPKEITELLEHRATLGKWLAKLEELSGTVRPEVYDRVRGDYEVRLRSQEKELTAHRSEMETALEERKTRVTVLESDRDERAAELEEAQLRFAVGEFKEAEFQKHKSAHEDRLTTLDDELKSDQDALAKLEEVVGVLGSLRAGASGSAAGSAAALPEPSGSAEGETSWGTAHGRAEEGVEGAVEKTKSAAAAAAVAVADARAADQGGEARGSRSRGSRGDCGARDGGGAGGSRGGRGGSRQLRRVDRGESRRRRGEGRKRRRWRLSG